MTATAEIAPAGDISISTFDDAQRVLARALPGYERRPQQQRLAEAVEGLFARSEHFVLAEYDEDGLIDEDWTRDSVHVLGQAGTGVGKSLGYLIPAVLSGRRVVVSVTTKALQSQLGDKDLPFLTEHLGVDFEWTVLKGRGNYLCGDRLADAASHEIPNLVDIVAKMADPDFDGLRESLGFEVPHSAWALICSESDECSGHTEKERCYAAMARKRAHECNIVVVNHALFCTDLAIRALSGQGFLPAYEAVIFDEAHELEEVAGNTLGGSLSEGSFASLTTQVRNWASEFADEGPEEVTPHLGRVQGAVSALFAVLEPGRMRMAEIDKAATELGDVFEAATALRNSLKDQTIEHTGDYRRAQRRKSMLLRRSAGLLARLTQVIADDMTDTVRWVEMENTKSGQRKAIKIAPVLVAPFLREHLFSQTPCALVSATLAVKGKFDYITARLGIDTYTGLDVGTPFDFATQARLYVPLDGMPDPSPKTREAWRIRATLEIHGLVRTSNGRALVLFTSVKDMKEMAVNVRMMLGDGFDLRLQGDQPTGQMIEWLREHDEARPKVLFATKSFFTGVDIPGEALSLVVISKMPFPVPTEPLTEARCEAIEAAGGNSFSEYTVPVMSLILQQAVGRLIRSTSDTGVVAILDPRVLSKGYGKQILRDLPPMTQVYRPDDVREFLGAIQ